MNHSAQRMVSLLEQMIQGARGLVGAGADPNGILLNATKGVSEALKKLIISSQEVANKQNDPEIQEVLLKSHQITKAACNQIN